MNKVNRKNSSISSAKSSLIIIITFAVLIASGTICLLMPFAVKDGYPLTFQEALFTSISCSCVTGLSIISVWEKLSVFGLSVQMILSQIGGIGIITFVSFLLVILNQKISQKGLENAKADSSSSSTGNIRSILISIIRFVMVAEAFLIVAFFIIYLRYLRAPSALFNAVYHTIMSFCNSGFMIFEAVGGAEVLRENVAFQVVTIISMFLGSIGYFVLEDIYKKKSIRLLNLNTKLIVMISLILIIVPSLLFTFVTERGNMSLLDSIFMSTTCRTTGMSIVPFWKLSESTYYIMELLMFVGGAPGSMAGGLKVSTLAALILAIKAIILDKDPQAFKRRISWDCINKAMVVFTLFIISLLVSVFLIKTADKSVSIFNILFDSISALSTTGLSISVGTYSKFSNYILCLLMFMGRIGPFTLASLLKYTSNRRVFYIEDDLVVG